MTQYKLLDKCLCCNGSNLITVLDLGEQPLANSYCQNISDLENTYPLAINYCNDCTHIQLTCAVDPDLLFKNYLYVSGTTKTGKDYFDSFVGLTSMYFKSTNKFNVLDIACNDGSQLDSFKQSGHNTFGIDPAVNLFELSSKNHNVICDYLTTESINKLNVDSFDIMIAQNVFAHNTYPKEFLEICKSKLSSNGRIFVQTSQANMIEQGQFDTIYHEHISFFNIKSMSQLVKRAGLYLLDVLKTDIHGTSYVFVISNNPTEDNSDSLISGENTISLPLVQKFANNSNKIVAELKNVIDSYKSQGYTTVGYGAAAKGNTLLNFGKIQLDYIVDDNPLKCNLFTPGRKIQILDLETLVKTVSTPILWIPLSWNFYNEIKNKIKAKRPDDTEFVKYFPEVLLCKE